MGLEYTVSLPEQPAKDLGSRELKVAEGDKPEVTLGLPADATEGVFVVERGAAVSVVLVDVDTSGNRSAPSPALVFTAADTIPPQAPGELSVKGVREVD